ncbi:unnamed protein product [Chrysoparadoxa australica]
MLYGLEACEEALQMSGLSLNESQKEMAGVSFGSGMGNIDDIIKANQVSAARGYRRVSPHFVPRVLLNLGAGHISIRHGFRGPQVCPTTACATGAHAIGEAYRLIKQGDANVMLCGGSEACIGGLSIAGFGKMRALCTSYQDAPVSASRPFDKGRAGFVIAEGAAALVLEERSQALARGASILAEVRGFGSSSDASHVTAPCPSGEGAARAMRAAIRRGGVSAESIGHINAHATSTPLGDAAECRSISTVFGGEHQRKPLVSSTKGATGHLLGAAGALEAAFTVMAIHEGAVPHTLNLLELSPDTDVEGLEHVRGAPSQAALDCALCNSFGFGGANVSLLFSRP